jgi:hypothetical protein
METEFEKTLDLYRKNLVDYKVTGNTAFKVASDSAKKWLDEYLTTVEKNVEKNKKDIQEFVTNYAESDAELTSLKQDMKKIRKEGPELQILYETEHNSEKEEGMDFSVYYAKGAVLVGVVALIAVASFI